MRALMTNSEWSYNATQAQFYNNLEDFLEKQKDLYNGGDGNYTDDDLTTNIFFWWNRYTFLECTEPSVLIATCAA